MSNPRPLFLEDQSGAEERPDSRAGRRQSAFRGHSDSAASEILSYSFLRVFVSDGLLDEAELRMLEDLALRDGVVDSKERAVFSRILDRIDPQRLDDGMRESIRRLRERHDIR
jgi:hypothetical protein